LEGKSLDANALVPKVSFLLGIFWSFWGTMTGMPRWMPADGYSTHDVEHEGDKKQKHYIHSVHTIFASVNNGNFLIILKN
jgi:hypothetical protein